MSPTHVLPDRKSPNPWWKLIDWRLVAAAGLPVWAFAIGMMVPVHPTAEGSPEAPSPTVLPSVQAPLNDAIPPPREIVVRPAEPITLPVVIPVPLPPEAAVAVDPPVANPPEFQLPATELLPAADPCQTFGTSIRFHRGPAEAITAAKAAKKMLFVLHISGHFDDPGFT